MTSGARRALDQRREALRVQLQTHRQIIAQRLDGDSGLSNSYPRSKTMRLLSHQPELFVRAFGGLLSLLRFR